MITIIVPTVREDVGQDALARALENPGLDATGIVVTDEDQMGFTWNVNQGILQADVQDHICIAVDDCIFPPGWLVKLVDVMLSRDRLWFAGPSGPCRTPPQNTGHPMDDRKPMLVSHLAGFCLVIRKTALAQVGLLDERFKHYGSDIDYQWRARERGGGRSVWVPEVYVDHELHRPRQPWWREDNELFRRVWQ